MKEAIRVNITEQLQILYRNERSSRDLTEMPDVNEPAFESTRPKTPIKKDLKKRV